MQRVSEVARTLGMSRATVYWRLKQDESIGVRTGDGDDTSSPGPRAKIRLTDADVEKLRQRLPEGRRPQRRALGDSLPDRVTRVPGRGGTRCCLCNRKTTEPVRVAVDGERRFVRAADAVTTVVVDQGCARKYVPERAVVK